MTKFGMVTHMVEGHISKGLAMPHHKGWSSSVPNVWYLLLVCTLFVIMQVS